MNVQPQSLNNMMLNQIGNMNINNPLCQNNKQSNMGQENNGPIGHTPLGTLNELCSKAKVVPVFNFSGDKHM